MTALRPRHARAASPLSAGLRKRSAPSGGTPGAASGRVVAAVAVAAAASGGVEVEVEVGVEAVAAPERAAVVVVVGVMGVAGAVGGGDTRNT